jgi:hypothetical protein
VADEDLGTASIVYDLPAEGTVEWTGQNEHLVYFQDHWLIKLEETAEGDVIRRIPRNRVHYVERSVEEFEAEIESVQNRVRSVADDLQSKVLGDESKDREPVRRAENEGDRDERGGGRRS